MAVCCVDPLLYVLPFALQSELRDLEDLARKMKHALVKKKALSAMPALMTTEAKKFAEL